MSEPRKSLTSVFQNAHSAIVPHFFLTDIYCITNLIGFAYSLIAVGFGAILMLFFGFVSQKSYPERILRPEVMLSRSYLTKCSIWPTFPIIINLSFLKNAIISEPLGVKS